MAKLRPPRLTLCRESGWDATHAESSASASRAKRKPLLPQPGGLEGFALLLTLAQNDDGLRMDAVVLHGIRRLVALHEVLERLHVGDLGDKRGLV